MNTFPRFLPIFLCIFAPTTSHTAEQNQNLIGELRNAANIKEIDFMKETFSWLDRIDKAKLTGAQAMIAYTDLARFSTAEYAKESEILAETWRKLGVEARKFRDEVDNKDIAVGIKKQDDFANDLIRANKERNELLLSYERERAKRISKSLRRQIQSDIRWRFRR